MALEVNYSILESETDKMSNLDNISRPFPPLHEMPYLGTIKVVPMWEIVVKSLIYGIIIIFSLIGNALIIAIVLQNRKMRTATNYYIVNLAVADIMVTVSCTWVTLVDDVTEGWVLGAFFCKFNTFTQGNQ